MDQLPRYGKRELICLLLLIFDYVVSVWRVFLCLRVLGMGFVILFWHYLSLPYIYFEFDIVNFPFLDGDVPCGPSYGVYISQLIRFARVCSHVDNFNTRNNC